MTYLALIAAIALTVAPQNPPPPPAAVGAITGLVVSARSAAPVASTRVTLQEIAADQLTTADGRFAFRDVKPGEYTLTVSTIGYIFLRRHVTVAAGETLDLTVRLAEGTGTYEEAVNVSAAPTADPGSTVVELGSGALQDLRGVAADDPVRAVQALPGVATGDDFNAQFSVRGSAFRHVGIVIEGTATPLLFHSVRGTEDTGSIAMINTDVLSRASLSTGPHAQRQGDWIGATLDFEVREGSRDRAAFHGAVSGTSASFVVDGPLTRSKRGSWLLSLRKSYVDWLVRKIDPEIDSTIGFSDAQGKLSYDLTSRQQLQLFVISGWATLQSLKATSANEVYRARSTSVLATASWRYVRNRLVLSQRLSLAQNHFRNSGRFNQEQAVGRAHSWIWRADGTLSVSDALTIEGGFKGEQQVADQTLRNLAYLTNGNGSTRIVAQQPVTGTRTVVDGWTQVTRRGQTGSAAAGVRVSNDTLTGDLVASPWALADRRFGRFQLRASVGQAHQFPGVEQFKESVSPILTERATSFDLGLGQALTKTVRWGVTGFYRRETNILRRVQEDQLVNGARVIAGRFPVYSSNLFGTSRGVDLLFERRAEAGFTGWLGYTFAHTPYRDRGTGEAFDSDFDQRHTLNMFVQRRLSYRLKVSAKLRVGSNFPIVGYYAGTPPDGLTLAPIRNAVRLPTYARLDLNASRTFTFTRNRLTLFMEMMNVTNRRNYGTSDGAINSKLQAVDVLERLIPFVPSAGILLEF